MVHGPPWQYLSAQRSRNLCSVAFTDVPTATTRSQPRTSPRTARTQKSSVKSTPSAPLALSRSGSSFSHLPPRNRNSSSTPSRAAKPHNGWSNEAIGSQCERQGGLLRKRRKQQRQQQQQKQQQQQQQQARRRQGCRGPSSHRRDDGEDARPHAKA